jgi:kinesin family member 1
MLGDSNNPGVIPLLCQDLISEVDKLVNNRHHYSKNNDTPGKPRNMISDVKISSSFYEIYNEKVYDLLSPTTDVSCRVREHPNDGAYVEGLSIRPVSVYEDVAILLEEGRRKRSTATTLVNVTSSRSHAIFTIYLEQKLIDLSSLDSLIDRVSNKDTDASSTTKISSNVPSSSMKSSKKSTVSGNDESMTTASATRYR